MKLLLVITAMMTQTFCQPKTNDVKHICWEASVADKYHPKADYYTVQIDDGDLIITSETCVPIDVKPGKHKAQVRSHTYKYRTVSPPSEIKWEN